jgi:hypothetical protein
MTTDALRHDLRYALRSLRRAPAFSITVVLILALGIGMTSAMFKVFESVVLTKLPMRDQARVVELDGTAGAAAIEFPISPRQLDRFRAQTRTLEDVAGMAHWRTFASALTDGDRQINLRESVVTDNFFRVLDAKPALGRLFQPGDAGDWGSVGGGGAVVVLSYGTWQKVFGGDPAVIGHHMHEPKMNSSMAVVGVGPAGLDYPQGVQYWVASKYGSLDAIGRLAPGATADMSRTDYYRFLNSDSEILKAFASQVLGARVQTVERTITGDAKTTLFLLSVAVALLLLLACVNVGNLLLLRAVGRVREMAIRQAIGATTSDIVMQPRASCSPSPAGCLACASRDCCSLPSFSWLRAVFRDWISSPSRDGRSRSPRVSRYRRSFSSACSHPSAPCASI